MLSVLSQCSAANQFVFWSTLYKLKFFINNEALDKYLNKHYPSMLHVVKDVKKYYPPMKMADIRIPGGLNPLEKKLFPIK